ncbi:MAG: 1-acyl-sn-glycerol-3-phosphate acyltransferase [Thermoleophilaceae bacterium]|nr:1-acyl-sn-glycerol-3-phosphate acyltransferase [Thermoleophilaceae bacterium]
MAREKGVSRPLYALVKGIVAPFLRVWFRMSISGAQNIPAEGAAIVAPNHKSFFDSFFIAVATTRHLRFMGKNELFTGFWGKTLVRLGAFPVRRGASDQDALETARVILDQGGLLALFPEGTRVREPEDLGTPKKGASRLALESGAPLVPTAIAGTESLFAGPFPKPRKVSLSFAEPIPAGELDAGPEAAGELTENVLWPEVESQFQGLVTKRRVAAAGLAAAAGLGGYALKRRQAAQKRRARNPFKR